jgi:hypothetical protein
MCCKQVPQEQNFSRHLETEPLQMCACDFLSRPSLTPFSECERRRRSHVSVRRLAIAHIGTWPPVPLIETVAVKHISGSPEKGVLTPLIPCIETVHGAIINCLPRCVIHIDDPPLVKSP